MAKYIFYHYEVTCTWTVNKENFAFVSFSCKYNKRVAECKNKSFAEYVCILFLCMWFVFNSTDHLQTTQISQKLTDED